MTECILNTGHGTSKTIAIALCLALVAGAADARGFRGGGGGFRGGGMRAGRGASMNISRPAGGFGGNVGNRGNVANLGNRTNVGNVNFNNSFNRNTNIDRNVNRDVDRNWNGNWNGGWGGWGYRGWGGYPVARAAAWGAAAGLTAAAVGSIAYSLPAGCVSSYYSGNSYYNCGGTWYQPSYQGTQVNYTVVNPPT